jgi:hypothetical protein
MTLAQCHAVLEELCRRQGTDRPLVKVVAGAAVVRGRLAHTPAWAARPRNLESPYGVLVVEHLGLTRGPSSFVQIASIPDDGLSGIE